MLPYLSRAYSIFLLTRPVNALQPIVLAMVGCIIVGETIDSWRVYALLVAVLLVHGAVTMWNDIQDVKIDRRNKIETIFTTGYVRKRTLQWVVFGQFVAALCLCFLLPPLAWLMLAVLVLVGWQYSARPFMLSRRPLLSMAALAVSYGFLPLLLGASLGAITPTVVILAILWSLSRVSLSLLKDYKDVIGDARHDKRTFLLVYGRRKVRVWSIVLATVGNAGVIYFASQYISDSIVGLYYSLTGCLFVAGVAWRLRLYAKASYSELHEVFQQSLYMQLLLEGVILLCLMQS